MDSVKLIVGDRVSTPHGAGTVRGFALSGQPEILVEHDVWDKGHSGSGVPLDTSFKTTKTNCWFYDNSQLTLLFTQAAPPNYDDDGFVPVLPSDSSKRKAIPLTSGVLDYFPAALAEVAKVSKAGNDQHNPGESLHWARGKSADHADTITRHLLERGSLDKDGMRHSAKVAWRALALLQEELEADGVAPRARGAW